LLTALGIAVVAFKRLLQPIPVDGGWVMAIAALSFVANLGIALLLQRGAKDDLNIRSAFWHMLGDAWVSLGVVISGGAILFTGWAVLDPLVSLLVVAAITKGAWPLFKESLDVLLESTPPKISASHVAATIEAIPGVKNVHDLHIWAVEPRLIMMTCHILVDGDDSVLTNVLLHTIRARVSTDFGIKHMTIQMGTDCCHPDDIHCDLTTLAKQHQDEGLLHVHH
jgi:cobalt-zinc-cadmium efflux system protein